MGDLFYTVVLLGLAADHLTTGIIGVFAPTRGIHIINRLFGTAIPSDTRYAILLRPWGAMGIFVSFVGLLPLFDSVRYEPILYGLVGLLLLRIYVRTASAHDASRALSLSIKRNYLHVTLIALCAIVLASKIITQ